MNRTIIISILALLVGPQLQSQTLKAFLKAADEAIVKKDYHNALYYFGEATEFDTSNLEVKYNYGESAKQFNAYSIAEKEFSDIVKYDESNAYPDAPFHLAHVQQNMGKYEEAKRNYELYISENSGDDPKKIAKAEKEIEAIDWAIENQENPVQGVTVTHLDTGVNTPYSDFGAVEKDDELYYSSLRFNRKDDNNPNRLYSKILTESGLENSSEETEEPEEKVTRKSRSDDQVQQFLHEAHTSFNQDGSKMYYTICNYENSYDIKCDIYVRTVTEKGFNTKGTKLPSHINAAASTSTHPNIAFDAITGKEILYFVSDREGGQGALDIWYSELDGDTFGAPINLSEVNTIENEVSPFFHTNSGTLYFSSDGYLGMGGYDIFESAIVDDNFTTPQNLKAPRNTSFNDLYYTLNEEGTKAYFSSNRTGSLYLDEGFESCCYDIYQADIEEIEVELDALTFDGLTNEELLGARVRIYDAVTDELLFEKLNSLGHDHKFKLKCGKQYTIITDAPGFETDTTALNLKDCEKPITKKIYLSPIEGRLDVTTLLAPENTALNGATVTLYDLSNPDSKPIVLTHTNANLFQFDILGGREYKLVAERDGFETKTITFKAIDFIDGVITKEIIFDKVIINLNEYLPVTVYFDNDHPDRRSRKLYTAQSYTDTYYPYIAKKQEFMDNYSKTLSGDLKASASNNVDNFFESDVKYGYSRMKLFIDKLLERLKAGEVIELSLKGFASPKAANKYNLALGQRRIWTIKNELLTHASGDLRPFIDAGKLQVLEISYGEEASPRDISDSYNNKRLSVYSVEASKERKAEIVRVKVLN